MSTKMIEAREAADSVQPFLSARQWATMSALCNGEEGEFFQQKFIDLAQQIDTMPKTFEQSGKCDQATVHLHYFLAGSDWYITEKDVEGALTRLSVTPASTAWKTLPRSATSASRRSRAMGRNWTCTGRCVPWPM